MIFKLSSLYKLFSTHMWCDHLCGYHDEMNRIHFTCLFCRIRREHVETPIDKAAFGNFKKDYSNNTLVFQIKQNMPNDGVVYFLMINNRRRFAKAKGAILKKLLTLCEALAN